MKIGIVGGGASGLFLASYLKRKNLNIDITIFDRNKSLGRKILASGNGKCNFSNFKAKSSDYNNFEFIDKLYLKTSIEELINYLSSLGLMFYFDNEGRMYPLSNSSQTILDLFLSDLKDTKVNLNYTVKSISYKNNKFYIDNFEFDYIILASGSNASIDESKINSTYEYFKNLNLKMIPLKPSLVGYKCKLKDINLLKGYRCKSKVEEYKNDNLIFEENGEVIFKEDGISGIVIMNSSHYYNKGNKIILNLLNNIDINEFKYKLSTRFNISNDPNYYLSGILHPTLIRYLIKENIIEINNIIDFLTHLDINAIDTYSLKEAQVSKGGISIEEIDDSFKLNKYPHIYATGEVLDINGLCGGYNLMFAFLSALTVGKEIEKIYENKNN